MMINKKIILFLSVLCVVFIGIGMVSATDNITVSDNHTTQIQPITHINNTMKEVTQTNLNNKTIKKDTNINTWDELTNNIKNNGTYTLQKDIIATTKLTTTKNTNSTINGNGHTIIYTTGEIQVTKDSTLYIQNVNLNGSTKRQHTAISNYGTLTIMNCSISKFDSSSINGGAIYSENCTLNCINNTFKENTARYDGGVIHINNGKLNCINNTFEHNNAGTGGAIYINYATLTNISGNIFIKNNSTRYGSAIYLNGNKLNLISNIYSDNIGENIIYVNDATITSTNNTYSNNIVSYGTIYVNYGNLTCNHDKFINNTATREASAVYTTIRSNTNINDTLFKDNLVSVGSEGGETLYLLGTNTLSNNTYKNNSIAFNTKNVETLKNIYTYHETMLFLGNDILKNPSYYDNDILNNTNISLEFRGVHENITITQIEGNNNFIIHTMPVDVYNVYETLSIAQSTYNNYKSNTLLIGILKQPANTTIHVDNITYSDTLIVTGNLTNITDGTLNVSIIHLNGTIAQSQNVTINGTKWSAKFYYVDTGNYTAVVTCNDNNNYEPFTNNTIFHVTKCCVKITVENVVTKVYHNTALVTKVIGVNGVPVNLGNIVFKIQGKTAVGVNNTKKVSVHNGTATLMYYPTAIKNWTMQVVYSGNSNYEANTSNIANLTILPRNLNVNIILQNPQKGGNNITLTAVVTDRDDKSLIENGTVVFKINDVSLKGDNGNILRVQIHDGIATTTYILPDGMSAGNYKLSAVAGSKNAIGERNNTILTLQKRNIIIMLDKITVSDVKHITVTGTITDDIKHMVVGTNKVCVKINGTTIMNGNKTVFFYVKNGVINFTIPSKYTNDLIKGVYNLTLVSGDRQAYNSGRNSTMLTVL